MGQTFEPLRTLTLSRYCTEIGMYIHCTCSYVCWFMHSKHNFGICSYRHACKINHCCTCASCCISVYTFLSVQCWFSCSSVCHVTCNFSARIRAKSLLFVRYEMLSNSQALKALWIRPVRLPKCLE